MCLEKTSPFIRMLLGALLGIVLGICFGLLFGLLIGWIASQFASPGMLAHDGPLSDFGFPAFLGMGAGAAIGAILGGIYANKK